jgi:hypothetical protein
MAGPLYRIKLYGHSGQDGEWFVKKLAVVLQLSDAEAEDLVHAVPVVIKEGIEKDPADRLGEILTSIQALFLVEPMGEIGETAEAQPTTFDVLEATVQADRQDALRADIWMIIGVVGAGILIVLSVVGYISSWRSFSSEASAPTTRSSKKHVHRPPMSPKDAAERIRTLGVEISASEKQENLLEEHLKLMVEDKPPSSDFRSLQERDKRLIDVGRKLADARLKVLRMKKELKDLEQK